MIEKIPRIKRRIAHKFKRAAMHEIRALFGHHVGVTGGSLADLRRHHAGTGLHFMDRVHVEIGKRGPAQFGVRGGGSVHREHGRDAALPVGGKLLREVRRAIGVRHRARRQQQQLAEVALVQGQAGNFFTGKMLAAGALAARSCCTSRVDDQRLILPGKRQVHRRRILIHNRNRLCHRPGFAR